MKTVTTRPSVAVITILVLATLIALFSGVSRHAGRYSYPMVTTAQPGQEIFVDRCDALMSMLDASAGR